MVTGNFDTYVPSCRPHSLVVTARELLLRSPRAQQWLNRVAGVVFLGLAVRLATSQR
jgi:threonine/homoserine/homoserine lactone efflux protein